MIVPLQMSKTAQNDAEFEAARKEAQRLAQQQRGASALAALSGASHGTTTVTQAAPVAAAKPPAHGRTASAGADSVVSKVSLSITHCKLTAE